ncbi:MAG: hypothetical protein M1822_009955 [Bathelium mastoideum]|nr:MAG: hypothetical protein M1822_009955 [Bathelium mastoideum]
MDVNSLLSPPEAKRHEPFMASSNSQTFTPLTSFHSDKYQFASVSKVQPPSDDRLPLSPPISPYTNLPKHHAAYSPQSHAQRDPELFPEIGEDHSLETGPLFPPEQAFIEATVDNHIMKVKHKPLRYQPTKDEYLTVASMVSTVVKNMKVNPTAWLNREREYLNRRLLQPQPSKVVKKYGKNGKQSKQGNDGYRKIAPKTSRNTTAAARRERQPDLAPKASRAGRTPRQTPKAQLFHSFDGAASATPRPTPRQPTARDDDDFNTVTDMTPPLSTLDNNARSLKMDWKGQARDLSTDPNRHLLHESEIQLASILRLSCAQYLTAKRKIFIQRVECAKKGKEFRKTDAQQACKIDVNKASKLWTAFEKVGWLQPFYIQQFL